MNPALALQPEYMLQAHELRVGNFVQFRETGNLVQIEEIYKVHPYPEYFIEWVLFKNDKNAGKHGNSLLSDFIPVPITPEVLVFMGFVTVTDLENYTIFNLTNESLQITGNFFKEKAIFKINTVEKELFFLHQLQNILFELFAAELNR